MHNRRCANSEDKLFLPICFQIDSARSHVLPLLACLFVCRLHFVCSFACCMDAYLIACCFLACLFACGMLVLLPAACLFFCLLHACLFVCLRRVGQLLSCYLWPVTSGVLRVPYMYIARCRDLVFGGPAMRRFNLRRT